jgi:hypothetical protein
VCGTMQRYIELRRNRRWNDFLHCEWELISGDETVQTYEWARHLVYNQIKPLLERTGYIFSCSIEEFVNCLLNSMYRHEQDFRCFELTTYMCKHACACSKHATADVLEHFHTRTLPPDMWEDMRRRAGVEHWADESEFAERFWIDLPHIVFAHIDFVESNAIGGLKELLAFEDDENEATSSKKQGVDPYLLDYYGARYKKATDE